MVKTIKQESKTSIIFPYWKLWKLKDYTISLKDKRFIKQLSLIYHNMKIYPENTIIDQSEQTSVTNLERRIFDLDINKLINNWRVNKPSHLYLIFSNT